ncbi:MAG: nuclear transport factor 2 family protein [Sphingobacteriales bacterium]|nr:MAG: nuclear transport factor 2 family protein [Sphingobacteriales bacterium]
MKQYFLWMVGCFLFSMMASAQSDSLLLVELNQQADNDVVKKNITALEKIYADDFVFTHGTGKIDNKSSWLRSAAKGLFVSRNHDSVTVEMHKTTAIVKGKLSVVKNNREKTDRYHIYYLRVFCKRENGWQMVSHYTTREHREK